jgi:hypothetical protein
MLPGLVAGQYTYDDCHIDLSRLARFAQARLVHAEAHGVDPQVGLCPPATDCPHALWRQARLPRGWQAGYIMFAAASVLPAPPPLLRHWAAAAPPPATTTTLVA